VVFISQPPARASLYRDYKFKNKINCAHLKSRQSLKRQSKAPATRRGSRVIDNRGGVVENSL
jgi:hypothetical protein